MFDHVEFHESSATLAADATLVLYTDGLVERPDQDIDVGISRLARQLADADGGAELIDEIVAPVAHAERRDDVAVLVLRT